MLMSLRRQISLNALGAVASCFCPVLHATEFQVKTVKVNGATLEFVEQGTGTPVVFVHGAASDWRVWRSYADAISSKYRFIAYTRRYFGKRPWTDQGQKFTREQHAADLVEFVQTVSKEPVHLMTWSSGGDVGTHANLMRPDLFRSIVNYEPLVFSLASQMAGIDSAQKQQFVGVEDVFALLADKRAEEAGVRFLEIVWDLTKGQGKSPGMSTVREVLKDNARTIPLSLSAKPFMAVSCEALGRLRTPALILTGGRSKPFFSMFAEQQGLCQANAVVATISGANHSGPAINPEAVLARAVAFWAMFD